MAEQGNAGESPARSTRERFNLSPAVDRAVATVEAFAAVDSLNTGAYAVFDQDLRDCWISRDEIEASSSASRGEILVAIPPVPPDDGHSVEARINVIAGLVRHLEWGTHMAASLDGPDADPYARMVDTAHRHLFGGGDDAANEVERRPGGEETESWGKYLPKQREALETLVAACEGVSEVFTDDSAWGGASRVVAHQVSTALRGDARRASAREAS